MKIQNPKLWVQLFLQRRYPGIDPNLGAKHFSRCKRKKKKNIKKKPQQGTRYDSIQIIVQQQAKLGFPLT